MFHFTLAGYFHFYDVWHGYIRYNAGNFIGVAFRLLKFTKIVILPKKNLGVTQTVLYFHVQSGAHRNFPSYPVMNDKILRHPLREKGALTFPEFHIRLRVFIESNNLQVSFQNIEQYCPYCLP